MERYGYYTEKWAAEAVARSFRKDGKRGVGVKKISNYHYTVTISAKSA